MFKDNLNIAIKNIKERKSRVFLTLLGIAIGIMAIVSLMSIGEGMQQAVTGELSSLTDTIIVTTGKIAANPMGGGFSEGNDVHFTDRDIDDMKRIEGIRDVSSVLSSMVFLKYNGETIAVSLLGMDAESMANIFGIDFLGLEAGSFMHEGEQNRCIVGYNVAHEYFDTDISVGKKIELNGKNFVVNGIYKKQGAGFSTETDDNVHLTARDFEKLTGEKNVSGILVRVYNVDNVEYIADEIESSINENHGEEDFASAITMSSILESIQSVLAIIQVVLLGIAAIALVVASIGIMNTMLTSVMERTHEIGIMKAIGAKNSDVMVIFILEGILISIIGGTVGVLLGIAGAKGFSAVSTGFMGGGLSLSPVITPTSILLALSVATFVGVISSLYPARKAAKMSPIEAVRYE
ncbi:MAG: ABC transporter permease [Candidatus Thermoplasmatota archaeon]|nr:ABC transporter permease [Candidatus Thermoplasmatota archaeon]